MTKGNLPNYLVLLTSVILGLLVAELAARTVLNPVDYLNPTIVVDEFLGELLRRAGYPAKYPRLAEAFVQEDVALAAIIELLHEQNIEVLDLLPPLEAQVRNRDLYQLADPHPNREGYRVIAETIDRYLRPWPSRKPTWRTMQ
jgi:hypothetical protein